MNQLKWLFFTQPSTTIAWIFNHPIIKWILNRSIIKRYITVKAINILCLAGAAFLIVYDFRLADDGIPDNTWSELMRIYGQRHLVLPWLCGVLIGHLFHHGDDLPPWGGKLSQTEAYNLIFWLSAFMLGVGLVAFWWDIYIPIYVMTIVAILGYGTGYYLWPIKRETSKWTW